MCSCPMRGAATGVNGENPHDPVHRPKQDTFAFSPAAAGEKVAKPDEGVLPSSESVTPSPIPDPSSCPARHSRPPNPLHSPVVKIVKSANGRPSMKRTLSRVSVLLFLV